MLVTKGKEKNKTRSVPSRDSQTTVAPKQIIVNQCIKHGEKDKVSWKETSLGQKPRVRELGGLPGGGDT